MTPQLPRLSASDLDRYLARVRYTGPLDVTIETLAALHRAHLLAIPYENLDIHLGRQLTLDPDRIFHKLVDERRGGWCYEMNGLFGRVIQSMGFRVRYVSGAVGRAARGDSVEGNHLVLIVTLGDTWIADVGFGDAFLDPLPLERGEYRQGFLEYGVARDAHRWTVRIHEFAGADSFDFTLEPRAMSYFARQCHELQTSPESGFVRTTVCQRFFNGGIITLRGAVVRRITSEGAVDRTIEDADEYVSVLDACFDLRIPGVEGLFPRVWERHLAWSAGA
jgi:N-hydroxyarylamine O-acetyltransferase